MGLLKKFRKYVGGKRLEWPLPYKEGLTFDDITVRDPFIVKDGKGGYVLAGTIYHYNFNDSYGTVVYKSDDLKKWRGPFTVLAKVDLDTEYADFWAPEIHFVRGRYRLLVTLSPKGGKRGTYMFSCDSADGKYKGGVRLTPEKYSCLDGTLTEENGRYWCIILQRIYRVQRRGNTRGQAKRRSVGDGTRNGRLAFQGVRQRIQARKEQTESY